VASNPGEHKHLQLRLARQFLAVSVPASIAKFVACSTPASASSSAAGLLQFWVHLFGEQKPFPMGMAARIGNALRFELNFGMGCKAYVLQSLLKLGRPRVSFTSMKPHFEKVGSCGDGSSSQS
jgi:hypothetical protein